MTILDVTTAHGGHKWPRKYQRIFVRLGASRVKYDESLRYGRDNNLNC